MIIKVFSPIICDAETLKDDIVESIEYIKPLELMDFLRNSYRLIIPLRELELLNTICPLPEKYEDFNQKHYIHYQPFERFLGELVPKLILKKIVKEKINLLELDPKMKRIINRMNKHFELNNIDMDALFQGLLIDAATER